MKRIWSRKRGKIQLSLFQMDIGHIEWVIRDMPRTAMLNLGKDEYVVVRVLSLKTKKDRFYILESFTDLDYLQSRAANRGDAIELYRSEMGIVAGANVCILGKTPVLIVRKILQKSVLRS